MEVWVERLQSSQSGWFLDVLDQVEVFFVHTRALLRISLELCVGRR